MFIQALQNQDFYTLFIIAVSATAISLTIDTLNGLDDNSIFQGKIINLSEMIRISIITLVSILTVDSLISDYGLFTVFMTSSLLSYVIVAISKIAKNTATTLASGSETKIARQNSEAANE